jgi:hypothetical protein
VVVLARGRHEAARLTVRAIAVVLVGLALAGCSDGDGSGDADAGTGTAAPVSTTEATPAPPLLAVFGDSLAFQAWSEIDAAAARLGYTLAGVGVPGDALCDAIDRVDEVLPRQPAYVVVAYVGNNNTPCTDHATGDALAELYEAAAEHLARATLGETKLVLVGPPEMAGEHFAVVSPLVRERYERVARRHDHVTFVDGRGLLSPDGYAVRRPCLASEGPEVGCDGGEIVVRFLDGVHLDWPDDGYSAGGRRWADTIVSSIPAR